AIVTRHGDLLGLAVHPSRPWAATTGTDGSVRVWDLPTGRLVLETGGAASGAGPAVALSARLLAVASGDGIAAWTLDGREHGRIAPFIGRAHRVAIAFAPAGEHLFAAAGPALVAIDA